VTICLTASLIWYDGFMSRFSISTVFICIAVALVVLSFCKSTPVIEPAQRVDPSGSEGSTIPGFTIPERRHMPDPGEVAVRVFWAEPLAFLATLATIHGVRKLWQSIPHKSKAELSDSSSQSQG
jgi:hypothetical protein